MKRRRNKNDNFRQEYGYSWDYFMAFRVYDEFDPVTDVQLEHNLKSILSKLTAGGLELRMFYSLQVLLENLHPHGVSNLQTCFSGKRYFVRFAVPSIGCSGTPIRLTINSNLIPKSYASCVPKVER